MIDDTQLQKTVLCTIEDEGPVVCKFQFQKDQQDLYKNIENEINKIRNMFSIYKHPNILVYEKVFNIQKKTLMGMRQFVCHNLKEKLHRIPKLSLTEKKWLVFQLLCAVSQIHQQKSVHGDIKPDNIVMTSYNWLFITDQVPYKPTFLREDDLKLYNLFFGELDNNQRCYLAPERFRVEWDESLKDSKLMEASMDVFSAGCVIAEIFMDGIPLFDLAHLQNYRKSLYDPRNDLQKRIKDTKIVNLIMSMIEREPSQRQNINQYILQWNHDVFPRCFSQVYFQIGAAYLRPQFLYSDQKISVIRKYIDAIWFACFGKTNAVITEEFCEPIEVNIFEKIRDDTIERYKPYLVPSNDLFQFLNNQSLQFVQENEPNFKPSLNDKEGIIVVVHWIGSFIHSCFFPQTKICALEMLYKIGLNSSIEMRLQFILPYILTMFEDENSKVKAKAIEVAVMIFADVLDQEYVTTLTATDYKVFDNYILPAFLKLKNESTKDQFVQHVFVRHLPMLAQIGHRFLELSVGSRFQKRQQQINHLSSGQNKQTEEYEKEEEIDSERLFSHNDNLLQASTHHNHNRSTIVIRDEMVSQKIQRGQDAMEVFVNYDAEYDKLRRIILSLINDILSETEPSLQRILFENLGILSIFFGRKMTIDNLIPLSNSCFNKKDHMLRMECLKGIPYLGLRVGSQTLAQYLLITCTQLLYDSEENVVFEMIKALTKLLEFRLMSKEGSLENLDKLLPFLMHPNTWVRHETIKYINFMANPDNKILSKAEAYCLLRPKLKQYLKKHEKVFKATNDILVDSKLKPSLSREVYEYEVKGIPIRAANGAVAGQAPVISDSDKEAIIYLKEVLDYARAYYSSFKREKVQKEVEQAYVDDFRKKKDKIKTYRLITIQTLAQLAGLSNQGTIFSPSKRYKNSQDMNEMEFSNTLDLLVGQNGNEKLQVEMVDNFNCAQYANQNFYSVSQVQSSDIERINYGLNKRVLNNTSPMDYETDILLQALNIVPEDSDLPIVGYKSWQLFQNLAIQSIQVGSLLHLEQSSQQPVSMPQFSQGTKTLQVQVAGSSSSQYTLGHQKFKFPNWRPTGRLITTLYEHKNPVNCFAVTDDSSYFFTASGKDGMINIWSTYDIERDITSHSQFTIKNKRNIRAITVIQNSSYFAVAGSQGGIDIYQMSRLEQEQSMIGERQNHNQSFKNPSLEKQNSGQIPQDPNYTSIIKTIEKKDEGDIMHCLNMILPVQQQHVLSYVTQRGSLYFHDLRCRFDVQDQFELFGCQRGIPTSMTQGQDPYQLYFGTLGGYVVIYDIRYGLVSQYYKHYQRAPINSIAAFCPPKSSPLHLNRSDPSSPLALISTGASNYEVSLVNLWTNDVEILLTVDDTKNKDYGASAIPSVPQFHGESLFDNSGIYTRKNETTASLFSKYLQYNRNSTHFNSLVSLHQQQLIKIIDEEWLKHSKNRYMLVKTGYESNNACSKILIPRRYNSLLHNSETANYAITGGNDKKLRYWDFQGLNNRSYYINTPNDDECQYFGEYLGDTYVLQERVSQFKQFPPYRLDSGTLSNIMQAPETYSQDGLQACLTGNALNGNMNRNNGVAADGQGDQQPATNFNGLAEWQRFNGLTLNQGCGSAGATEASNSSDYMYRDSQNVSHQDCILDMGMLELQKQDPILVTCGRDGIIKLWR